jgi:DNA polymerase elongation subunit (family B)
MKNEIDIQTLLRKEAQLQERVSVLNSEIAKNETEQIAIKILLNSLYGALG